MAEPYFVDDDLETLETPLSEHKLDFGNIQHQLRIHGKAKFYEMSEAQRAEHLEFEKKLKEQFKNELPADPRHPFYYHVWTHTKPPEAAYRLIPHSKSPFKLITAVDK